MSLLNYFEFIVENVDTFRLYYSRGFKDILHRIKQNSDNGSNEYSIANFLLAAENSNQVIDKFTLIDVTDKNDTISFIQGNRIVRKFKDITDGILTRDIISDENHELWKSTSRTNIGIGRWTRRIVKDVYKTSLYSESAFEKFVNAYKATFDSKNSSKERFEIVSGEKIRNYYLVDNYKEKKGQLGNSCMSGKSKQSFLDIYVKNPEVCQLLILKDNEDSSKIVGRSLLWNLENGEKYQDRIYTINDSDIILFKEWAFSNKYLTYFEASDMFVKLGEHEYDYYPYMDTFTLYNPINKKLTSNEELWPGQDYIKITNTDGSYTSDNSVWSEYHGDYIDRENAVECKTPWGVDFLYDREAIWLEYRSEWWVPCDEIVWSEYHEDNFHIDDVMVSELMRDYLWVDSKDVIQIESNSYGDVDYVVKDRPDLYFEIDGKYYDRSNCIKDPYTGEYEFKDKMMDGHKTYHKYLKEKLEEELGKDADLITEKVVNLFKSGKYPDIKDSIKENPIYSYLKSNRISDDDIICLLFTAIIGSTGVYFPSYIKKFSDDVYDKYNTWYNTGSRLISRINRFIKSFDYTLLGDDIYKIYLWFSL
jgi:hypothetical protein